MESIENAAVEDVSEFVLFWGVIDYRANICRPASSTGLRWMSSGEQTIDVPSMGDSISSGTIASWVKGIFKVLNIASMSSSY